MGVSAINKNKNEIVILPDSDDETLCVRLKGVVAKGEFEIRFLEPLTQRAGQGKKYNLLIHYDESFEGWEKDAAEISFQSIIDYGATARKLAYVNPPDSKLLQIKMARPLFGGEIRFFDEGELDQAIHWVKA